MSAQGRGSGRVDLGVEPARAADAEAIVRLRDGAARWQQARGIPQWLPGGVTLPQVRAQVADGQWHVVRCGEQLRVQAALRVLDADAEVWGPQEDEALYVHGLVVDRALSGQGLGADLLRWVQQRAHGCGRPCVRLDCVAANAGLRSYYLRQGFRAVGVRSFDNGWSPVVLLERSSEPDPS